jgi:ketosteroid isomerase-like protein
MNVADAGTLVHIENIKQLKARYFRFVDSKQWDALRDVFTDDVLFYFESPTPAIDSADSFVAFISQRLATAVSVHHGHMPEISIIDDSNATGVWAMYDWVDDPDHGRAFQGYGHYRERYRRGSDGNWRISELRLERIRVDPVEPGKGNVARTTPAPRCDDTAVVDRYRGTSSA